MHEGRRLDRSGVIQSTASQLKVINVDGEGYVAGVAYGRAARELIHNHLDHVFKRRRLNKAKVFERVKAYRTSVQAEHPEIAAEIDGIAEGAEIPREAAWLLQLRAEVTRGNPADVSAECTTFGATGTATTDGATIVGHNGDLPAFYRDTLVLVRRRRQSGPDYMTLTPAGQLAWQGINEHGVVAVGTFLDSDWLPEGTPRYLLTRIALDQTDATQAAYQLQRTRRSSPRNMLVADEKTIINIELAAGERSEIVLPEKGIIVHANHHISALADNEKAPPSLLHNSRTRQLRMEKLLYGRRQSYGIYPGMKIDVGAAMAVLRDRGSYPDTISWLPGDNDAQKPDFMTVSSIVADVKERVLFVAIGAPHTTEYKPYKLSD